MIAAGHGRRQRPARAGLADADADVRSAALGALARSGGLTAEDLVSAMADPSPRVRRRACEESARWSEPVPAALAGAVRRAAADPDPLVVESACWALGEHRDRKAVPVVARISSDHPDPRCREAAVAALGAIGDPSGLPAVLGRLTDRPVVRRRAVVALAAFDDPEALRALEACRQDRDWQVRQAAEILGQD